MKTRTLLVMAVLAASTVCINAQKLLINENFSTQQWEDEFIRLNPTYVTPATGGAAFTNLANGPYFDKYDLYSGAIEVQTEPANGLCADGTTIHLHDGVAVAWRLKKSSAGASWIQLPKLPNAGTFTMHAKTGAATPKIRLQMVKIVDGIEQITELTNWNLTATTDPMFTSYVDELKTFNVNSRDSITLRIGQGADRFIKIFGFQVEEHFSAGLKHSIDSATVIKNDNADNIGTVAGQYPQAAYDDFVTAIADATTVFDNTETTQTEVEDAELALNTAITDFEASMIDVGTGFNPANTTTLKQYGRKLVTSEATRISIFNVDGSLLYQQDNVKIMDVPASIRQGIYLVKSKSGVQKMYFGE
jgi:hypothetical protein